MFKIIKKYKKWKDYFNLKEPEVIISMLVTVAFFFILLYLNIYNKFDIYLNDIKNIFICIIGAFIGLIGFALSGLAILSSMFSKKQIELIEKQNGRGTIEKVMSSFAFLAFNAGIYIMTLIAMILVVQSDNPIINFAVFNILEVIVIYFLVFNIFYTISLVFNCISCFSIKNTYDNYTEKDFFDKANEIRIDYILSIILQNSDITAEEFVKKIEEIVKRTDDVSQEELVEYFNMFYLGKKK